MKTGFYPGSFNPWHEGHQDVLDKSLKLFDKIVILQLTNPGKEGYEKLKYRHLINGLWLKKRDKVQIISRFGATFVAVAGTYILGRPEDQYAVIRGMRNTIDFEQEKILQYAYEDSGVKMPIFHIISDRKLVHYSSTLITSMNQFTENGHGESVSDSTGDGE